MVAGVKETVSRVSIVMGWVGGSPAAHGQLISYHNRYTPTCANSTSSLPLLSSAALIPAENSPQFIS